MSTGADESIGRRDDAEDSTHIECTIAPYTYDIEVSKRRTKRLPFGEIAALGAAFASVPEQFRTIEQSLAPAAGQLYRVVFPEGSTGVLKTTKAGKTYGFTKTWDGASKCVTLVPSDGEQQVSTEIPYDPTSMFMAAALMQINEKLDEIQTTQQEMFEYIRNKDKASLRGNLATLSDVLSNYQFNYDNAQYKTNKHVLVQQIRNDAEAAVIQHRAQIVSKLEDEGLVHVDKSVRDKVEALLDEFEEYRLSVYLYAYSSFLEIMLLENFDQQYLDAVAQKIEERSLSYRVLYTKAYNLLDAQADSSVSVLALGGVSSAMGLLGRAIEKTPVGDATSIDEALHDASHGVSSLKSAVKEDMIGGLVDACSSDVRPFVKNIKMLDSLFNEPSMLLSDGEAIYVVPITSGGAEIRETITQP